MELRKGQAEDRLAELRVLLAWKSAIFRTKVRPAGSYNARTRAWAEVRSIAAAVQRNARAYELARKTMWKCSDEASEEGKAIRQCFQPLTKHDLKVSTEYILPEIRGARNTAQSWIWNSGATKDIQDNAWLEECTLLHIVLFAHSNVWKPDRRVVWLRGKARRDRWQEEVKLLSSELDWTQRYFDYQRQLWTNRALEAGGRNGYVYYARRKAQMWNLLYLHARHVLATLQ